MIDTSDGLDLGGLTVRAPVPPVLIVSAVSFTLHDVLLASVARVLIAHKRSTLHVHGAHLRHAPAHGLQRGVVVTQLSATAHEVLPLIDGHTAALVSSTVDGAEGHEALNVVGQGTAEGIPVGVLSPLQNELLTLEVMVLITHPGSTLHADRADVVKTTVMDVAALSGELHASALEVLLLKDGHLKKGGHTHAISREEHG